MHVLITGCAGFIGSHVAQALLTQGHEVVGIDAFTDYYARSAKERNLDVVQRYDGFTFHEIDLRLDALHGVLTGCDAVVNLAAMPGLPRSWSDFEGYSSCNLLATQRLAQAALDVGVSRFVHASTSSVYGRHAVGDETLPTRPVSPYGVTKLAAEHLLMAYHEERGLPAVILRYFSIYGPRQRPDMAYHIFAESLLSGRPLTVHGDGGQSRSSTYIGDCVRGTLAALQEAPVGEVYNIGGGQVVTLLEALSLLAELSDTTPRISFGPRRAGDQGHTAADTGKAARAFGYAATTSPLDGLRHQLDWHVQCRTGLGHEVLVPGPRERSRRPARSQ